MGPDCFWQAKIIGIDFIINLSFLPGLEKLKETDYKINYLIDYDSEEVK